MRFKFLFAVVLVIAVVSLSFAAKVTLRYGLWGQEQYEGVLKQIELFEKLNPDIKVEVELVPWGQYWTKLQTMIASGDCWDVFWMNIFLGDFADRGAILELTPLIERDKVDLSPYSPVSLELGKWKGKIYFIPRDFDTIALFYNKDMFDAAGVKYPDWNWTYADLILAAEKLTKRDKAGKVTQYGIVAGGGPLTSLQGWLFPLGIAAGADYFIDEDKADMPLNALPFKFAASLAAELTKKGFAPKYGEIENAFMAGKAAMSIEGSWMFGYYVKEIKGFRWGVAPLPKILRHGNVTNSLGNVIWSGTKYKEEAWKLVKFLASREAEEILGATGAVIPAHKDATKKWIEFFPKEFRTDAEIFIKSLDYAKPFGTIPGFAQIFQRLQQYFLAEIVAGNLDPVGGLEQAYKEVVEIIKQAKK
ncbi:ABC transporter substrate-binding protein [Pseudothermotoga sp.]